MIPVVVFRYVYDVRGDQKDDEGGYKCLSRLENTLSLDLFFVTKRVVP